MNRFQVVAPYAPAGDQRAAITKLSESLAAGERFQTLLGITGSGKSATIAWTIAAAGKPALILAPNKSLAAQLYEEMRAFFPHNRVEYFVSYYDYYQPEAYLPASDTYIEKDSAINEEIDRLRHAATAALLTRRDTVVVASVSAIYGLGDPAEYARRIAHVSVGHTCDLTELARRLATLGYERNDQSLIRGRFRIRGDVVEVHPVYEERPVRIELFGDEVERITVVDNLAGESFEVLDELTVFPATHYGIAEDALDGALASIKEELLARVAELEADGKLVEAQRLTMRTEHDLEMLAEVGSCAGIENYSRHFDGRRQGEPPPTLLDFLGDDWLLVIDESHVTIPQIHGQFEGDRSRKETLIAHGFRLPSAADNRPLRFGEFYERINQAIFMSATPAAWEVEQSSRVVEQIIRPTGLLDPAVEVRPTRHQVEDLLEEIRARAAVDERVLVTTLTKKMAEDLSDYLLERGAKVRYLHSNVHTFERIEIIRDLRAGLFDVLVGINLLREGLDIPEVSLVAILDADKEGFLRSETALVQTIGRAARNANGHVIMYADVETGSMRRALDETARRRMVQQAYNAAHEITPVSAVRAATGNVDALRPADKQRPRDTRSQVREETRELDREALATLLASLEGEMRTAAAEFRFEDAARLRDELAAVRIELAAR